MNKLYLVPDRCDMERIRALAAEYGCAFEYNDFFLPKVMEDPQKQKEIIENYRMSQNRFHLKQIPCTGHFLM